MFDGLFEAKGVLVTRVGHGPHTRGCALPMLRLCPQEQYEAPNSLLATMVGELRGAGVDRQSGQPRTDRSGLAVLATSRRR